MNKLTFSLNYRKPKSEYKKNDELMICIRYYHKESESDEPRIIKKSTGIKCKLKDWDEDWHKSLDRCPIKPSDPNHSGRYDSLGHACDESDCAEVSKLATSKYLPML